MLLTDARTIETKRRIQEAVEAGLKAKNVSARRASLDVVGNDGLIRDIRAGVMPAVDRLEALMEYLGLSFQVGPQTERARIELVNVDGADFSHIPLHEAYLSAGPGVANGDVAIIEHLVFREEWLRKIGISAERAALARISGDSMSPGIQEGDTVLIDRTKREIPIKRRAKTGGPPPIYAFIQDGEARVKRVERPEASLLVLLSDNPSFPPELVIDPPAGTFKILGQVVWSGHVWR